MRDGHVIGALGNEIYAQGIGSAATDTRYSIIHVDEKLYDPETRDLLGYSGMYVGSGPVAAGGDPAKLLLTESTREALQGDKLFPESVDVNVDFVPHAPASDIKATRHRRAQPHGHGPVPGRRIESRPACRPRAGHVLAISQVGGVVRDRYSKGGMNATTHQHLARPRQSRAAAGRARRARDGLQGLRPHELRARDGNHARDPPGRFGGESVRKSRASARATRVTMSRRLRGLRHFRDPHNSRHFVRTHCVHG